MVGFVCWNRWAIWVKCFCASSGNYWASGMVELSLHPLFSGSVTKVSLWSYFPWSTCKTNVFEMITSLPSNVRLKICLIWPPLLHCTANRDKSAQLRHTSRLSPTNCPFSDFFTPPTAKGAQGQKLKRVHLPARHFVLSEVSPTHTDHAHRNLLQRWD